MLLLIFISFTLFYCIRNSFVKFKTSDQHDTWGLGSDWWVLSQMPPGTPLLSAARVFQPEREAASTWPAPVMLTLLSVRSPGTEYTENTSFRSGLDHLCPSSCGTPITFSSVRPGMKLARKSLMSTKSTFKVSLFKTGNHPELGDVFKGFFDLRQKTKQCVDQLFKVRLTQNHWANEKVILFKPKYVS